MSLLNAGSAVDVQDHAGCTPLHFAAAAASEDDAKYAKFFKLSRNHERNTHKPIVFFNCTLIVLQDCL